MAGAMLGYVLEITYRLAGQERRLLVKTLAGDDAEALRACYPVMDLAEWEGASGVKVSVTTDDGREVGSVGEHGDDRDHLDRCERHAGSFQGERSVSS